MSASPEMIKDLRERTGAGIMECKRALEASGGEIEKAIIHLREQGILKAAQKVHRETKEGQVFSHITQDRGVGVLLELTCETDFVARTEEFHHLGAQIATQTAQFPLQGPSREDVLDRPFVEDPKRKTTEVIQEYIAKFGENIALGRVARYTLSGPAECGGVIESYIHLGGKLGVLVELSCTSKAVSESGEFRRLAREIAMQVAASSPLVVSRQQVSQEILEREREIYRTQAQTLGKPEAVLQRVVEGKLEKFYTEVCLLEQPYIKDPDHNVGELIKGFSAKLGEVLTVVRFARFRLGE